MNSNSFLNSFPNFCNQLYNQQTIPSDQSSISNFTDITNNNNLKMVNVMDNLDDSTFKNKILKHLYSLIINFKLQKIDKQLKTCDKINFFIDNIVNNNKNLMDKILILNNIGLSIFFNYDVCENPNDGKPYILCFDQCNLPFTKNYYFDKKYIREISGFNNYCENVLNFLKTNFQSKFGNLDINTILHDVNYFINMLSPLMLSNVSKRDISKRINYCTLDQLKHSLPHINFLNSNLLTEFNVNNTTTVIFPNDIYSIKNIKNIFPNFPNQFNYCDSDDSIQQQLDNGEFYWAFINNLFYEHDVVKNSKIISMINNYIIWTVINNYFDLICEQSRIIKFNFYGKFLSGQKTEKNVKLRAIEYLSKMLPELIGELFCSKFFNIKNKSQMTELTHFLLDSYNDNFTNCSWMDHKTRNEAINKLNALYNNLKIGFPEISSFNEDYTILYDIIKQYILHKLSLFEIDLIFSIWYKQLTVLKYFKTSVDNSKWEMSAIKTNAYYHPLKNEIVFPAGILQEPFYIYLTDDEIINGKRIENSNNIYLDRFRIANLNPKYSSILSITMASNFGAIGAVIGHEISHGFDDNGSQFNYQGKYVNWWSNDVKNKYNSITQKIVDQYNSYFVDINVNGTTNIYRVNGKLTLGENIADLFGLRVAIDAYKKYHNIHPSFKSLNDALIELFISFANTWRYIELPEKTKNRIAVDVHSPPNTRIIGTLKNIKEFYEVFDQTIDQNIINIF